MNTATEQIRVSASVDSIDGIPVAEPILTADADTDTDGLPAGIHSTRCRYCNISEYTPEETAELERRNNFDRHELTTVTLCVIGNDIANPDFVLLSRMELEKTYKEPRKVFIQTCHQPEYCELQRRALLEQTA